jgi:Domain of unknown function (DUF1127)
MLGQAHPACGPGQKPRPDLLLEPADRIADPWRALAMMSDRSLRDIGVTRYDATREPNKPFWRA